MSVARQQFDYVIVGGGTAGCIIAARLAEDASLSIALVEGGPALDTDPMVLGYHGAMPLLGDPRYDYDYEVVPAPRGNSGIRYSRAKMLGGCSSHNDTIAFLPQAREFEAWESLGAEGWSMCQNRPYFERAITKTNVHRVAGENQLACAAHRAAIEFGLPEHDLHTDQYEEAAGWLYLNERDEVRQSTAVAYLYPLQYLPENLTLLTETWAQRVVLDGDGRATGVQTSVGTLSARNEVILCAGAIDTPRLLMFSGIGPRAHLKDVGIDPIHDLAGVGENLQDHLEVPVVWSARRDVGPSLQSAENVILCKSRTDLSNFDVFIHVVLQPYYLPIQVDGHTYRMPEHAFCLLPNVSKPKSAGTVRLNRKNPAGPPLIDPMFLTDPEGADEALLREGVRIARALAQQPSLRTWVAEEVAPGSSYPDEDDEHLGSYVRQSCGAPSHPTSTCRIGNADDDRAVVDPELRVRGLVGLRIADASIFPEALSVTRA